MKVRKVFYATGVNQEYSHGVPLTANGPLTVKQVTVSTNCTTPIKIIIKDGSDNGKWEHFVTGQIDWHGEQLLGWDGVDNAANVDLAIKVENLPQGKHCFVEVDYAKE